MTQNEIQNAVYKIFGYHSKVRLESDEVTFYRAKDRTIEQLKKDLTDVESITKEQFDYWKKKL
jgi:hypothetical protein